MKAEARFFAKVLLVFAGSCASAYAQLTWTDIPAVAVNVDIYKGVFSSPVDFVSVQQSLPWWSYPTSLIAMSATGQILGQCLENDGQGFGTSGCLTTVSLNGNGATYAMSFTAPSIALLLETSYSGGPPGAVSYSAPADPVGVPEPSTFALMAAGLVLFVGMVRTALSCTRTRECRRAEQPDSGPPAAGRPETDAVLETV
jgi:hypothetical protein